MKYANIGRYCGSKPLCPHIWCENHSYEDMSKGTRMLMSAACGMARIGYLIDEVHKKELSTPKDNSKWVAKVLDFSTNTLSREWRNVCGPTTKSDAEFMARLYSKQFFNPPVVKVEQV